MKKKINWERPNCNCCGKRSTSFFLKNIRTWEYKDKFNVVGCSNCNLKYLSPRPSIESIGKYYSKEEYWGRNLATLEDRNISYELERKGLYNKIYKNILRTVGAGSIYDVGAGIGLFLTYFKELGWTTHGNEISENAVKYANSKFDIDLRYGNYCDIRIPQKKYDVITFNSSLEHMHDPKNALLKASKMLKNDGLLVVTVPNIESLGFKIFKKDWLPLHPPKHLYHFSKKTLTNMILQSGFRIDSVSEYYFSHAFYGIYNSLRYKYSLNFIDMNSASINVKDFDIVTKRISFLKVIGKIAASLFSFSIVMAGSLIGKGETITVYAKKH
jgi:2-polyprenyl-3-methyl-5-hydroxy-6-metoxy-1,4-benzoquinol methylase